MRWPSSLNRAFNLSGKIHISVNMSDSRSISFDFAEPGERSWQLRYDYDYDFTALGVPGLTFMTRYVRGDQADANTSTTQGREWERNTDIAYVVQSGALKNVGIKWRNASYRSNFTLGIDENRLIVTYTLPIW
jgi:hypothetical protein